jgi:hypothetical protein
MARKSQRAQIQDNPEQCPMPSQPPQQDPVSLVGPPARVPQPAPYSDIVIDVVEPRPVPQPDPTPVVTIDDNGSITIN